MMTVTTSNWPKGKRLKTTPWKFRKPTYIIKAVQDSMASPYAQWIWPMTGPVDDRHNFQTESRCGGGLYGFTVEQVLSGDVYSDYLKQDDCTTLLLLEVESREIVTEPGNKCKVPRCNVHGVFKKSDWSAFLQEWYKCLNRPNLDFVELTGKFLSIADINELSQADKDEFLAWLKVEDRPRLPGEGCTSPEERKEYLRWKTVLGTKVSLSEEDAQALIDYMTGSHCPGVILGLWAGLQNSNNVVLVYRQLVELLVAIGANHEVPGLTDKFTYKMPEYYGMTYLARGPSIDDYFVYPDKGPRALKQLTGFSTEDQKKIEEMLFDYLNETK